MSAKSFEIKLTIRIYDAPFVAEMDKFFEEAGERYESKNHFFNEMIRKGFELTLQEKEMKEKGIKFSDTNLQIGELQKLLEEFIKFSKGQIDIANAHFKVVEKLSANIMNIAIANNHGEAVTNDDIKSRELEELPEHLEKIIIEARYKV